MQDLLGSVIFSHLENMIHAAILQFQQILQLY